MKVRCHTRVSDLSDQPAGDGGRGRISDSERSTSSSFAIPDLISDVLVAGVQMKPDQNGTRAQCTKSLLCLSGDF